MPPWLFTTLTIIDWFLIVITIVMVLRQRKEPAAMVAWIAATTLLPFIGFFLFMLIGENRIRRQVRRRVHHRQTHGGTRRRGNPLSGIGATLTSGHLADLAKISTRVGNSPPISGNEVTIYLEAERAFLDLGLAIEAAQSHVHMEYYIWQPDETGRGVRDILIRKAREGVPCRVLLDGFGSWSLSRDFIKPMADAGVELVYFLPVKLGVKPLHLNCRNHRKLVVIDGRVGFTGSQNIGDEYLARKKKFGPWRDTQLRLRGPAALAMQDVFVDDWHYATGRDLTADDSIFPAIEPQGNSTVQVVASGPDGFVGGLHMLLSAAVSSARRSVYIMTPYFAPDTAMMLALQAAALRGVRVQLLLPTQSDAWLVLWAGRSNYDDLLEAGVEIFEFGGGMLHSKVVIVDDTWSLVGSANIDVRSFKINFELTTVLYDENIAHQLTADFTALRDRADLIKGRAADRWRFDQLMAIGLARMVSPLL